MTKIKTKFVCQVCGYESIRWFGRCPNCQSWNSFIKISEKESKTLKGEENLKVVRLDSISQLEEKRLQSGLRGFDFILGGGIVEGAVILLSGEPGIGKSTLLLQIAVAIQSKNAKVLYLSAEETLSQVGIRLKRVSKNSSNLQIDFVCERDIEAILPFIEKSDYSLVIVDSIQTVYSSEFPTSPGNVVQVRECTNKMVNFAKKTKIPVILVGHVTKEGDIAGPKLLEHLVDVVLYLEGERYSDLRVLRVVKNRFGPTNDFLLYEMKDEGLIEVEDISQRLLENRNLAISGSIVIPIMEGTKPLLVEVQALVSKTNTTYPRRITSGIDLNKVILLLAVLEKKLRINFSDKDVFLNVVGGLKIEEPAIDLGIVLAILSALKDKPLPHDLIAIGEIGLGGEVRSIPHLEKRILEAKKFGFIKAIIPSKSKIIDQEDFYFIPVSNILEIEKVWG